MATDCSEDDETGSGNVSLVHSDSDDAAPQSLRQFCEGMSIGHMRVFAVACEQAERWDDMLVAMETLLDAQRLALSGAWCRLCGPRLHACRSSLSAIPNAQTRSGTCSHWLPSKPSPSTASLGVTWTKCNAGSHLYVPSSSRLIRR